MNRELYLKQLIADKGHTVKSFSEEINMPYSTLRSILNGSIGGAAVDNVIKICQGLGITISELQEHDFSDTAITLSEHEKALVLAYRSNPDMQSAVDRLLGISESADSATHIIKIAARGDDFKEVALTDSEIERLKKKINDLPDVDKL